MCHHRGYEYLREREATREEPIDEEPTERPEETPVVESDDELAEDREPAVPTADD